MSSWIQFANIDDELALLFLDFDFATHSLPMSQDSLEALYTKVWEY